MVSESSKIYFMFLILYFFANTLAGESKETVTEAESSIEATEEAALEKNVNELEKEVVTIGKILEKMEDLTEPSVDENVEEDKEKEEEKSKETEEKSDDEETEEKSEDKSDQENEIESPSPTEKTKDEAPEDTFAVFDDNERICILAKFDAVFSITYAGRRGDEKAEISVPSKATCKGKCGSDSKLPLLQISWQKYALTIMFNKSDEENWIVSSMELSYDTSEPLFDGAVYAGKKTARSKRLSLFETPLKKSYYCPATEYVDLYTGNKQVVTARIKDIQMQPYEVEDGKFSPAHRCNKVSIDGIDDTVFIQDETVPLAVGCTLAILTLIILVGFSVHRAINAAKADYNTVAP